MFYLIFLDFRRFGPIFIENHVFICGKWAGNTQELSRIYFGVVSDLISVLKSQFGVSKLDIFDQCIFLQHFLKVLRKNEVLFQIWMSSLL